MARLLSALTVLLPALAASCAAPNQEVADPGWQVLFQSDRSGDGDFYRVDPASGAIRLVHASPGPDGGLRRAGQTVVFASEEEGGTWLRRLPSAGAESRRLFLNPAGDEVPDWDASGERMVYPVAVEAGQRDLVVAGADGLWQQRLTHHVAEDLAPRWSPDGLRVAFVSDRAGQRDIWVVGLDGKPPRRLTRHPGVEGHPSWSPDGREVLFYRLDRGVASLWAVEVRSGAERRITDWPGQALLGAWSPDGAQIVVGSTRSGNWDLWLAPTRGDGPVRRLTFDPGFDGGPVWVRGDW